MDDLEFEDEPPDVKLASPVQSEIEEGQKIDIDKDDTTFDNIKDKADNLQTSSYKKSLKCAKAELIKVQVFEEPCKWVRDEIIPRNELTKSQYIDLMSKHRKRCPPQDLKKEVTKKVIPVSLRIRQLAMPQKRLILTTLQESSNILPPEMINNLIKLIEMEMCFSPEQAGNLIRCNKRTKKRCSRNKSNDEMQSKSDDSSNEMMDKDAVLYQYLLMQRFVQNMLNWKCDFPYEDYQDLSKIIFQRLCQQIQYVPTIYDDKKAGQIKFLADIVAGWVLGIVLEVAEKDKKELKEEMKKVDRKDCPEEVQNKLTPDLFDQFDTTVRSIDSVSSGRSVQLEELEEVSVEKATDDGNEKVKTKEKHEKKKTKEVKAKVEKVTKPKKTNPKKSKIKDDKESSMKDTDEKEDNKDETPEQSMINAYKDTNNNMPIVSDKLNLFNNNQSVIESSGNAMDASQKLLIDVINLLYCDLKRVKMDCSDALTCRIQNALYSQICDAINRSESCLLTDSNKVCLITGKMATWFKQVFDEYQIDMNKNSDQVDWLIGTLNILQDWFNWLMNQINQYDEIFTCQIPQQERMGWVESFRKNSKRFQELHLCVLEDASKMRF